MARLSYALLDTRSPSFTNQYCSQKCFSRWLHCFSDVDGFAAHIRNVKPPDILSVYITRADLDTIINLANGGRCTLYQFLHESACVHLIHFFHPAAELAGSLPRIGNVLRPKVQQPIPEVLLRVHILTTGKSHLTSNIICHINDNEHNLLQFVQEDLNELNQLYDQEMKIVNKLISDKLSLYSDKPGEQSLA